MDVSGGEHKRKEALQLCVLQPQFAIVDEFDSGLDMDALRMVSRRIEEATEHAELGVVAITHYSKLFEQPHPDAVHVFAGARIQESGGPELADVLEAEGYERGVDVQPAPNRPPTPSETPSPTSSPEVGDGCQSDAGGPTSMKPSLCSVNSNPQDRRYSIALRVSSP